MNDKSPQVSTLDVRFEDLQPDTKTKVLTRAAQLCDQEDGVSVDHSCSISGCAMQLLYPGTCPFIDLAMNEMKTLSRQWVDNL